MRFSALQENSSLADGDFFPSTDVSDSGKDKKITLATLASFMRGKILAQTSESFQYAGLNIIAIKTGGCVTLTISGTTNQELGTKQNYVDLCTLSPAFRKQANGSGIWYVMINGDTIGQVKALSTGVVQIGYTRDINPEIGNRVIPSGVGVWTGVTYSGV